MCCQIVQIVQYFAFTPFHYILTLVLIFLSVFSSFSYIYICVFFSLCLSLNLIPFLSLCLSVSLYVSVSFSFPLLLSHSGSLSLLLCFCMYVGLPVCLPSSFLAHLHLRCRPWVILNLWHIPLPSNVSFCWARSPEVNKRLWIIFSWAH